MAKIKKNKSANTVLNQIGINTGMSVELADKLNNLLASFQLFYMNARGFHWNIKGDNFFELHLKFEEVYTDAQIKIDEIAERILTLGHTPLHTFSDYMAHSGITEAKNKFNGKESVSLVLKGYQTLIQQEREILLLSANANDEGTNALMSDYIREQEKLVWMYSSYLN
jgi:starvation-inducible DNA-binding protein